MRIGISNSRNRPGPSPVPVAVSTILVDYQYGSGNSSPIDLVALNNESTLCVAALLDTLGGALTLTGSVVTINAASGSIGQQSILYTLTHPTRGTSTGTLAINFTAGAAQLVAADVDGGNYELDSGPSTPVDVLAAASNATGAAVTVLDDDLGGLATVDGSQRIVLDAATGELSAGPVGVLYHIEDTGPVVSNQATVSFNIIVPTPPAIVAVNDSAAATLGASAIAIDVLANDTLQGYNRTALLWEFNTTGTHGSSIAQNSAGNVAYTPPPSGFSSDTFQYRVRPNTGTAWSGWATVTITLAVPPPTTYEQAVMALSPAWYLKLADPSGTSAAALAGPAGTYLNSPILGVTTIAANDSTGKSCSLSGAAGSPPCIQATSPLSGAELTIDIIVQLDTLTPAKQVVATNAASSAGSFGFEVLSNGQVRAYSYDSGGAARIILGTAGDVQQGKAHKITYRRRNSASPSQQVLVDGVVKASDATARTWAAVPAGLVTIGNYGSGGTVPLDGLVAHVAGWNSYLSDANLATLQAVQDVAWAADITGVQVTANSTQAVDVRQGPWHGKEPLTASAGNGSKVTTTESGPVITLHAGASTGGDSLSYSFTDAGAKTSPTRTLSCSVNAPAGSGLLNGGINWATAGYGLTWARNPKASDVGKSGSAAISALNADGWAIQLPPPGYNDGLSIATRGSSTVMRMTVPIEGVSNQANNMHCEQFPNGLSKTGVVFRFETYMPSSGGWVNNGQGGKCGAGLWYCKDGSHTFPAGGNNSAGGAPVDSAGSIRLAWSGSQRFMAFAYDLNSSIYPYEGSYIADDSINGDSVSGYNNEGATTNTHEHLANHVGFWTRFEFELIWQTGAGGNGIIRLYINSVLKMQYTGWKPCNPSFTDVELRGLWLSAFVNGNNAAPQTWDFRNFEVWEN